MGGGNLFLEEYKIMLDVVGINIGNFRIVKLRE